MRHCGDLSLIEHLYRLSLLCPSILLLPHWLIQPKVKPRQKKSNGFWARSRPWKPKRIRRRTSTARIQVLTRIHTRQNPLVPKVLNPTNRVHLLLLLLRSVRYPAHTKKTRRFFLLSTFWLLTVWLAPARSIPPLYLYWLLCILCASSSSNAINGLISTRFFLRILIGEPSGSCWTNGAGRATCLAAHLSSVASTIRWRSLDQSEQRSLRRRFAVICFFIFFFPFCWAVVCCRMSQCLWLIGMYCDWHVKSIRR